MEITFYFYGTDSDVRGVNQQSRFSFSINDRIEISKPAYLIWVPREETDFATIGRILRTTKSTDLGMAIHVAATRLISFAADGIFNLIKQDDSLGPRVTGKTHRDVLRALNEIYEVPRKLTSTVKAAIIKNNKGTIDESYFTHKDHRIESPLQHEINDALHTGFRLFGIPPLEIPELREHQILDFDILKAFDDAKSSGVTPDGRHFFRHDGRTLYLHKVDRTSIQPFKGDLELI